MPAMKSVTYGFIGLGLMGLPMCRNLVRNSTIADSIRVFDLVESVVDDIVSEFQGKVVRCTSPQQVAEGANIIFTMLPEGRHVESVYFSGPACLFSVSLEGKLLIDCSTIDTATNLLIKHRVTEQFQTAYFVDAPVSGGVIGAQKGSISFFVGCDESDPIFPHIKSCLDHMGKQIVACGGPSLGLTAKLCNNYLSGILTIACSETFNIGMRAGLDPRKLYQVLGAGSAQNTICDKFCPVPHVDPESPSSHGYQGGFRMALMLKDFTLATQMADRAGARRIMGEEGIKLYKEASEMQDYKNLDVRAIFRLIGGQEDWRDAEETCS